jgi:excisionase family DNA binding protein
MPDHYWTAAEVAAKLRITPRMIRAWARENKLPSTRLGHRFLFDPREVERVIQQASKPAKPMAGSR